MPTRHLLQNRTTQLSEHERSVLESAISHTHAYAAGQLVVRQNTPVTLSTLLVEGYMTRHVYAPDGKRHLVALHVPGDFVDLHAFPLKTLDHDVGALTAVRVAVIPHAALEQIQATEVQLTRRLWFSTLLDAAMHRQWVFRLASLNATQRVAHFLCETHARLLAIGATQGMSFTLPMTQTHVGEVCGITNVHVNRVLRELREMGLCETRFSRVHMTDLRGLSTQGVFDPAYLYLTPQIAKRAIGLN